MCKEFQYVIDLKFTFKLNNFYLFLNKIFFFYVKEKIVSILSPDQRLL